MRNLCKMNRSVFRDVSFARVKASDAFSGRQTAGSLNINLDRFNIVTTATTPHICSDKQMSTTVTLTNHNRRNTICQRLLCDWLKSLTPLFKPIISRTSPLWVSGKTKS